MSKRNDRICCVCYRSYTYCPICNPEDKKKPSFYFAYCSENCRDIYKVTSNYEDGKISADTAKEELEKLDLSMIENFGKSYKNTIVKINENITKPSEQVVKETSEVVEEISKKYYKPRNKKIKNDGTIE